MELQHLPAFVVASTLLMFVPGVDMSSGHAPLEIAFLGVLFNILATSWWIGYVPLLDRVSERLRRSNVRRFLENLTGAVLVALGVRLAFERR